ncbi:hypothetical protein ACQP1G_18725 [Nocardia sp. CA-107356]|uniref:hypothetical protein n=1 Tax=Nocardia sp. CA-107356 TaxID=3239972 RepID=UPI003D89FA22
MFSHDISSIEDFIRSYDEIVAASDFAALPRLFEPVILVTTPTSSRCVSRAEFIAAARARARQFDSGSAPHTRLVEQTTFEFGGHYWLTSARWALSLGERSLDLYSDFLVRCTDDGLRIAAYLTRQDLPELVRGALDR